VSCRTNSRRVGLAALKCGVSRLSSQAAFYLQTPRGRSQLAGASRGAVLALGLAAVAFGATRRRARKRRRSKPEYDRLEAEEQAVGALRRAAALGDALDGQLARYVVTDPETGDRYATRNPVEARQFARALRLEPGEAVSEAWPGTAEFDEDYKPVPEAVFY